MTGEGTIYGDDKKFLWEKIKDEYGEYITDEQLRRIAGFKFHAWGRLSRTFLELQGCEKGIGEKLSLINMMWENNYNLMELMSDRFTYQENLAEMTYIKGVEKTAETEGAYSLVTAEKNLELYDVLTEKHRAGIYSKRPTPVGKKLVRARDKFEQLEVREQCKVILQILQLSQLSNLGADLRLVGESKNTGVSMISKNVTDAQEFKLIHQSPSGLFETEIDLKTV